MTFGEAVVECITVYKRFMGMPLGAQGAKEGGIFRWSRWLLAALLLLLPVLAQARGWGTTEREGVRWLTAPGGELFFSLGVNTTNGGDNDAKAKNGHAY